MIDWKILKHELPDHLEKYVVMLAEACSAKNELILIGRFQKVIRLIHDQENANLTLAVKALEDLVYPKVSNDQTLKDPWGNAKKALAQIESKRN